MTGTKIEQIQFSVPSGQIRCLLLAPHNSTEDLAVVLPGAGYSFRQPLLHFAIGILLQNGFKVLANDKVYGDDPNWRSLTSEVEARKIVQDDAVAFFKQIPELLAHDVHTVVARSLGTYALACALESGAVKPKKIVWQTPALGSKWTIMRECGVPGFGILGTADHYFKDALSHLPDERVVVENADHGMEIEDDPIRSIDVLKQVTAATSKWLNESR